jgi:hypothetical protein
MDHFQEEQTFLQNTEQQWETVTAEHRRNEASLGRSHSHQGSAGIRKKWIDHRTVLLHQISEGKIDQQNTNGQTDSPLFQSGDGTAEEGSSFCPHPRDSLQSGRSGQVGIHLSEPPEIRQFGSQAWQFWGKKLSARLLL